MTQPILIAILTIACITPAPAQDKLETSYASVGATNAIWNIAKERGFYKKHGLDTEVLYIGSTTNQAYLDEAYRTTARILERTPYSTREGMRSQLEQARAANPASKPTVDDIVDDSIVREIEKERFIDHLYR